MFKQEEHVSCVSTSVYKIFLLYTVMMPRNRIVKSDEELKTSEKKQMSTRKSVYCN